MGMNSALYSSLLALVIFFIQHTSTLALKKSYIVCLGSHKRDLEFDAKIATQSHYDLLESVLGSYEKTQESMQYNYKKYINGFVAKLSEDEVKNLKKSSDVISVFENDRLELQTTRSWEFLGLEENGVTPSNSLWNITLYGDGVIIANLDTGVAPESESFNGKGLGPIPSRWKGECMTGQDSTFKCNKKLIGARYFDIRDDKTHSDEGIYTGNYSITPRDEDGHGTHTLTTAGGSFVNGANAYGLGLGVAKGGSPNARVASYKVCWLVYCGEAEILAAFEAAIDDGVDVLSLSLAGDSGEDFRRDGLAIGAFHAIRHGINVVAAASNEGPNPGLIANVAPWLFTVGASTLDRTFSNKVSLGNSTMEFKGANAGPARMLPAGHFHSLILGVSASKNSSNNNMARLCESDSLDPLKVKGKIVVCESEDTHSYSNTKKGEVVRAAGGIGMIVINVVLDIDHLDPEDHVLPASHLHYKDGQTLLEYIKNTSNPTAYITDPQTELDVKPAPKMAVFSSRGPAPLYPQILKPDIAAPGLAIVAALNNTKGAKYGIMSGTSMACPHVAGVVGLIKTLHHDWSPAAIRSAIMTTATTYANDNKPILDYNGKQATPFAYGAGQINPNAAADPGLVYNLTETDYLDYLCLVGPYTEKDLKIFSPVPHKCNNSMSILDFNYPSITVNNFTTSATLTRKLTNVGGPGTYQVKVTAPFGLNVTVVPSNLKFSRSGEELTYTVHLKSNGEKTKVRGYVFGSLEWTDGTHNVSRDGARNSKIAGLIN